MSWTIQKVEDFADVITGGTPSTTRKEYWEGGRIPWLNSGDLNKDSIHEASNFITEEGISNSAAKLMPPDTVLIALTGTTTGVVGYLHIEASANQSVTGILPSKSHHPKYLYYYLKSIRQKILNDSYGGAQKHISQGYVKALEIPLPPLPIQKRIAEILDAADALRKKDQELLKKYDELAQAIFIDMFGDPVKNEKGWEMKLLEDVLEMKGGGTPNTKRDDYYNGGIPWVSPKDMKSTYIQNSIDTISELAVQESSTNMIPENSVLMVVRSGILKKTLPVAINTVPVAINQDMKAFLPTKYFTAEFLLYFFRVYESQILQTVRGTTADNISSDVIKNINLMLPPIARQNKFSSAVKSVFLAKDSIDKSTTELLFSSLISKAFSGELVS